MTAKYGLRGAWLLPYKLNEKIAAELKPAAREPRILVYGRPSVARNAFELISMALFRLATGGPDSRQPLEHCVPGREFP